MTTANHRPDCDRYWFLTWTTYATWLPGDSRGFVSPVRVGDELVLHNLPGTPFDSDHPHLMRFAGARLSGPPIYLTVAQAENCLQQFRETTAIRGWWMLATAIMRNHIHVVVGVPGDPPPRKLLQDYKSYASRALNQSFDRPKSETWWTESGSKRKLPSDDAIVAAVLYVARQQNPLVIWIDEKFREIVVGAMGESANVFFGRQPGRPANTASN
jgi:REP element-mobilizing transposase RayT